MPFFICMISRYSFNCLDLDNNEDMETTLFISNAAQNTEVVEGTVTTTAAQVAQSYERQEATRSANGQVSLQTRSEAQASTARNKNGNFHFGYCRASGRGDPTTGGRQKVVPDSGGLRSQPCSSSTRTLHTF